MANELATIPAGQLTLDETLKLGKVFAESGYFNDARGASQAVVKVLAGRELGFAPMASMTGIHIIEGKPSIGSHLMAAAIKRSGRYDYKVIQRTREVCELEFSEKKEKKWEVVGNIKITFKECQETGLTQGKSGMRDNWKKFADDMLFARAISKGYRTYCPDLTGGLLCYTDGEIEQEENGQMPEPPKTGFSPEVMEAVVNEAKIRNFTPEDVNTLEVNLKQALAEKQSIMEAVPDPTDAQPITDEQRAYLADKFKGHADYGIGLLPLLGLERFGLVTNEIWPFVRLCADHRPDLEWLKTEALGGSPLAGQNATQKHYALKTLRKKYE